MFTLRATLRIFTGWNLECLEWFLEIRNRYFLLLVPSASEDAWRETDWFLVAIVGLLPQWHYGDWTRTVWLGLVADLPAERRTQCRLYVRRAFYHFTACWCEITLREISFHSLLLSIFKITFYDIVLDVNALCILCVKINIYLYTTDLNEYFLRLVLNEVLIQNWVASYSSLTTPVESILNNIGNFGKKFTSKYISIYGGGV